jgi:hypothetical protein
MQLLSIFTGTALLVAGKFIVPCHSMTTSNPNYLQVLKRAISRFTRLLWVTSKSNTPNQKVCDLPLDILLSFIAMNLADTLQDHGGARQTIAGSKNGCSFSGNLRDGCTVQVSKNQGCGSLTFTRIGNNWAFYVFIERGKVRNDGDWYIRCLLQVMQHLGISGGFVLSPATPRRSVKCNQSLTCASRKHTTCYKYNLCA